MTVTTANQRGYYDNIRFVVIQSGSVLCFFQTTTQLLWIRVHKSGGETRVLDTVVVDKLKKYESAASSVGSLTYLASQQISQLKRCGECGNVVHLLLVDY